MTTVSLKKYNYKNEKIDEYMNFIKNNCEKHICISKKLSKIDNEDFNIPNLNQYNLITKYNYTIKQLKEIAQVYKLKISGIRRELVNRIFIYLRLFFLLPKYKKYSEDFYKESIIFFMVLPF